MLKRQEEEEPLKEGQISIYSAANEEADALARLGAISCPSEGRWIQLQTIITPTIEGSDTDTINCDQKDWRILIKEYILEEKEPKDSI